METGEALEIYFKGIPQGIANKGYSIVAGVLTTKVYVANYETGEVMLCDKFIRDDQGSPEIQISGDGRMVIFGHSTTVRRYMIGDIIK
jgi:hypothetical protein